MKILSGLLMTCGDLTRTTGAAVCVTTAGPLPDPPLDDNSS